MAVDHFVAISYCARPFAPVTTEVIAPELVAAAIAAEAKAAAAHAAPPPPVDEPAPPAEVPAYAAPTAPALDDSLPNDSFELEAIALDAGTIDLAAPQPEPFVPGAEEPPLPITEEPVVVFHPERLPIDGIRLSLRRRGDADVASSGEQLPRVEKRARYAILQGPGGKLLVVVDFDRGDRLALAGERVGPEMFDLLPGG